MKRWKTQEIVALIKTIPEISNISVNSQGGDVDTSNLFISIKGVEDEHLFVCGFVVDGFIDSPDDTDIEMIEVTDGQQSDTGLSSGTEYVCVAYARVVAALRKQGFQVVKSMDGYF